MSIKQKIINTAYIVMFLFFGFIFGFIFWSIVAEKNIRENPTIEYTHWTMEQGGYNYCPYCGEKLKEGDA